MHHLRRAGPTSRGSGGARACREHVVDISQHHPLWVRLPGPDDELDVSATLAELEASGAF